MFQSCLKLVLNSLFSKKLFSLINITGLAIGIAAFILILAYVGEELTYDHHHPDAERIVRLSQDIRPQDGTADILTATNSPQVASLLHESQPQVEAATRLLDWRSRARIEGGESLPARIALVDENFPDLFSLQWLAGDPRQALDAPDAIVLTRRMAERHFGNSSPLGETLILPGDLHARVTGVIENLPRNTHFAFEGLAAMDFVRDIQGPGVEQNWNAQYFHTYLLLAEGIDRATLSQSFPDFIDRHLGEGVSQLIQFRMTPLTELHLSRPLRGELTSPVQPALIYSFLIVAFILLGIACVNFTNLSTARASRRAREVGVRKAVGANSSELILQFLGETLLTVLIALILALALIELFHEPLGQMTGHTYSLSLQDNLLQLALLVGLTTLAAGLYPAFFMSAVTPASVLHGHSGGEGSAGLIRQGLVIIQFSAAVALMIATVVVYSQLQHARQMDTGYNREGVLVIDNSGPDRVGRQWDTFRQRLLMHPGIITATASNTIPVTEVNSTYRFDYEGGATRSMPGMLVDFGFFETYGIGLLAGRYFDEDYGEDRRYLQQDRVEGGSYILSRLAVQQLGWSVEEAIGKVVEMTCCGMGEGQVVGIVEDVHYGTAHNQQNPVVYAIPPEPVDNLHPETRLGLAFAALRIDIDNQSAALEALETIWHQMYPDQPLSYYRLDDRFNSEYQQEARQGQILALFSALAIMITCLGLYGLAAFNAELRTKEVGIRKVMGSSVWRIVLLLTNDFSKLVLISNLIAWPVAYIAMNRWLENFTYRIDLTPLIFIGSGLIALCIAWVTVGSTAAKAASAKPVLALRYE